MSWKFLPKLKKKKLWFKRWSEQLSLVSSSSSSSPPIGPWRQQRTSRPLCSQSPAGGTSGQRCWSPSHPERKETDRKPSEKTAWTHQSTVLSTHYSLGFGRLWRACWSAAHRWRTAASGYWWSDQSGSWKQTIKSELYGAYAWFSLMICFHADCRGMFTFGELLFVLVRWLQTEHSALLKIIWMFLPNQKA